MQPIARLCFICLLRNWKCGFPPSFTQSSLPQGSSRAKIQRENRRPLIWDCQHVSWKVRQLGKCWAWLILLWQYNRTPNCVWLLTLSRWRFFPSMDWVVQFDQASTRRPFDRTHRQRFQYLFQNQIFCHSQRPF